MDVATPQKGYIHVCLNTLYQPHHWMMPATVGGVNYQPVCGMMPDFDAPQHLRLLERRKADALACQACRRLFRQQARSDKKRRL